MKKAFFYLAAFLTSLFARSQDCPTITINSPSDMVTPGDEMIFTVDVKNSNAKLTYNWTISNGTIISGQGTPVLKVATKDIAGMYVTATVELGGLPANCVTAFSSTSEVAMAAELVVKSAFTGTQQLKDLVKKFITASGITSDAKNANAFVYLYKGPTTTSASMKTFIAAIASAFDANNVYSYQYRIVEGGNKKVASCEFYIVPEGAKDPKPSN